MNSKQEGEGLRTACNINKDLTDVLCTQQQIERTQHQQNNPGFCVVYDDAVVIDRHRHIPLVPQAIWKMECYFSDWGHPTHITICTLGWHIEQHNCNLSVGGGSPSNSRHRFGGSPGHHQWDITNWIHQLTTATGSGGGWMVGCFFCLSSIKKNSSNGWVWTPLSNQGVDILDRTQRCVVGGAQITDVK